MVLVAPPILSLILISSPAINVPDVSLNLTVVLLPPGFIANPVAPLERPSMNEVSGNSVFDNALFTTKTVNVCMSNRYKSNFVAAEPPDAS